MEAISRRSALSLMGVSAAAAATTKVEAAPAPAPAPAPALQSDAPQGAGFYRFNVGSVECFSIGDAQGRLPSFPLWGENASEPEVAALLRDAFVDTPPQPMLVHFNVLMFKLGSEVWLVDAGNGPRTPEAGGDGRLAESLARLGVKPGDVSGIIISHLHGDHTGGLFTRTGELAFPSAKFFLNASEQAFWKNNPDLSKTNLNPDWKKGIVTGAQQALNALEKSGRLEVVGDNDQVSTGLRVRKTGGHTPGHQVVEIESEGKSFTMLADAVHHFILSFRRPDWFVQFDYDAKVGAATRRSVLDRIASERTLVMCYHTPWPGIGHVRAREGSFDWMPIAWEW